MAQITCMGPLATLMGAGMGLETQLAMEAFMGMAQGLGPEVPSMAVAMVTGSSGLTGHGQNRAESYAKD